MPGETISRLQQIAEERGALRYGEFKLSAGGTSSYYFDGRLLTLDPEGGYLVAKALLPIVLASGAEAIAGPTLGADPIVASVATVSHMEGTPVGALIVRGQTKAHGAGRRIEGSVKAGMKVAVVDDTCTSGRSLLLALDALEDALSQRSASMIWLHLDPMFDDIRDDRGAVVQPGTFRQSRRAQGLPQGALLSGNRILGSHREGCPWFARGRLKGAQVTCGRCGSTLLPVRDAVG